MSFSGTSSAEREIASGSGTRSGTGEDLLMGFKFGPPYPRPSPSGQRLSPSEGSETRSPDPMHGWPRSHRFECERGWLSSSSANSGQLQGAGRRKRQIGHGNLHVDVEGEAVETVSGVDNLEPVEHGTDLEGYQLVGQAKRGADMDGYWTDARLGDSEGSGWLGREVQPGAGWDQVSGPTEQPPTSCAGLGCCRRPVVKLPGLRAMLEGAGPHDVSGQFSPVPTPNPTPSTTPASTGFNSVYAPSRRRRRNKMGDPADMSSPRPGASLQAPRQRVSIACTFCRSRKLRCTPGPGPCEHCTRRGNLCVFDYHPHHHPLPPRSQDLIP